MVHHASITFHVRRVNEASTLICIHPAIPGHIHSARIISRERNTTRGWMFNVIVPLSTKKARETSRSVAVARTLYRSRPLCQRADYGPLANKASISLTLWTRHYEKCCAVSHGNNSSKVAELKIVVSLIIKGKR